MFGFYDVMFWAMRVLGVFAVLAGAVLLWRDLSVMEYMRPTVLPWRGLWLAAAGLSVAFTGIFGDILVQLARDARRISERIESEVARRR